ncbi:hypothetical protein EON65_56130 [archaeon]|nr:MAG: hypothetical protein EON65_56130 [archaeon]
MASDDPDQFETLLEAFKTSKHVHSLKSLGTHTAGVFCTIDILDLLQHCPNARHVCIDYMDMDCLKAMMKSNVTVFINQICKKDNSIEELTMKGMDKVGAPELEKLVKELPKLKKIHLHVLRK